MSNIFVCSGVRPYSSASGFPYVRSLRLRHPEGPSSDSFLLTTMVHARYDKSASTDMHARRAVTARGGPCAAVGTGIASRFWTTPTFGHVVTRGTARPYPRHRRGQRSALILAAIGQELSVRSGVERRVRNRASGGRSCALTWAECPDPGRGRAGTERQAGVRCSEVARAGLAQTRPANLPLLDQPPPSAGPGHQKLEIGPQSRGWQG